MGTFQNSPTEAVENDADIIRYQKYNDSRLIVYDKLANIDTRECAGDEFEFDKDK